MMNSQLTMCVDENSSAVVVQLRQDVQQRLRTSCIPQLRTLQCDALGQSIVLRGRVDSYYLKQLAQELVKQLEPRAVIVNLVTVA